MKKFVALVALLIAVTAGGAQAAGTPTKSVESHVWSEWGIAPYATDANHCKKLAEAVDGMDYPDTVKAKFKALAGTTCKDAHIEWVPPDKVLDQMWTGGKNPHVMNNVTVGELPMTKTPSGRALPKGSAAAAAKALVWSVTEDGVTYYLYDFFACHNFSKWHEPEIPVRVIPGPPPPAKIIYRTPPAPHCPVIRVFANQQVATLQFIQLTRTGRVRVSGGCPFLYKGPGDTGWFERPVQCPQGPCDFRYVIGASGLLDAGSGGVNVKGRPGEYDFQVSPDWVAMGEDDAIYAFCLKLADGTDSCAKDIRHSDYHDGIAIVGYGEAGETPHNWAGHERIWCWPSDVTDQQTGVVHCEFCPH